MKWGIKPVARANGIYKNIGWHTFRHSFATLLKANGEDVKAVQEPLRRESSGITLAVYTHAVTSNKRAAKSKVVKMMIPGVGQNAGEIARRKLWLRLNGFLSDPCTCASPAALPHSHIRFASFPQTNCSRDSLITRK
jgi:hypothetical protein